MSRNPFVRFFAVDIEIRRQNLMQVRVNSYERLFSDPRPHFASSDLNRRVEEGGGGPPPFWVCGLMIESGKAFWWLAGQW